MQKIAMTQIMRDAPDSTLDHFGRPLNSLRISVTDRCNFRCTYCMPKEIFGPDFAFLPRSEVLSYEEIVRIVASLLPLGLEKVRITGGEPLLRRDISSLISQLRTLSPDLELSLTTNGTRLEQMALKLKDAGLQRINVSMDAIDPEIASKLAGRQIDPADTWNAVLAARDCGFSVKVNSVIQKSKNESQILPLAKQCKSEGITLRFIEYMDVGNQNGWNLEDVVTGKDVFDSINQWSPLAKGGTFDIRETARNFQYADNSAKVGFINSISQPFCRGCGRGRLTADGTFYTCLFSTSGTSIKNWVREQKCDGTELTRNFRNLWTKRKDRYSEERELQSAGTGGQKPEMWRVGG